MLDKNTKAWCQYMSDKRFSLADDDDETILIPTGQKRIFHEQHEF